MCVIFFLIWEHISCLMFLTSYLLFPPTAIWFSVLYSTKIHWKDLKESFNGTLRIKRTAGTVGSIHSVDTPSAPEHLLPWFLGTKRLFSHLRDHFCYIICFCSSSLMLVTFIFYSLIFSLQGITTLVAAM